MIHNAHYPTKFDGVYLPVSVQLIDTKDDLVIATFDNGSDFGNLLRELFCLLPSGAVTIQVGTKRLIVFGIQAKCRKLEQISIAVRDFIVRSNEGKAA